MISPARIVAALTVMYAAYTGGTGMGAAAGVSIGAAMDVAEARRLFYRRVRFFGAFVGDAQKKKRFVFAVLLRRRQRGGHCGAS
jgi:hypothetical protein